ncbi:MAG: hypothetical protein MJ219_04345 [Mycoplasmoidaceae bacterium]|nr:hypothetical protein [Mycoplasmoidaceae bacterium]
MVAGSKLKPLAVVGKGLPAKKTLPPQQKVKPSMFLKLTLPVLIVLLIVGVAILSVSSIVLSMACSACIDH